MIIWDVHKFIDNCLIPLDPSIINVQSILQIFNHKEKPTFTLTKITHLFPLAFPILHHITDNFPRRMI